MQIQNQLCYQKIECRERLINAVHDGFCLGLCSSRGPGELQETVLYTERRSGIQDKDQLQGEPRGSFPIFVKSYLVWILDLSAFPALGRSSFNLQICFLSSLFRIVFSNKLFIQVPSANLVSPSSAGLGSLK